MASLAIRTHPRARRELPRSLAAYAYERHNQAVRVEVPADRLIEWEVGQGWEPLCEGLGVPVPEEPFPKTNSTSEFRGRLGLDAPQEPPQVSRMRLAALVATSRAVAETSRRKEKVGRIAELLRGATTNEARLAAAYLAGEVPQGKIGLGPAAIRALAPPPPPGEGQHTLAEVDRALGEIAAIAGKGSVARRRARAEALYAGASVAERHFLTALLAGGLRQGALEALVVEALARATDASADAVRRAVMLSGSLPAVAEALFAEGPVALARYRLEPLRPVQPMLASPAEDLEDALAELAPEGGAVALELKLDGARVQVHKVGAEIKVFSRRLNEVSAAVPELIELTRALPAERIVLDGEVIAMRPDGTPHPFQTTMRRFGRRKNVAELQAALPLSTAFFDVLLVDDQELLDAPLDERIRAMETLLPESARVERRITAEADAADTFWTEAMARGHEGLMAKDLRSPYAAGKRGRAWRKLKPAHTLDLVVLAVEKGSGRRSGWLSNLHLGARDEDGGFVMLGKTFKGLSDALLTWQTKALQARAIGWEGHVLHVRPELVVEIALSDVQTSPHYPAGLALRFARVKRYRPDKAPEDADTLETVRSLHRS